LPSLVRLLVLAHQIDQAITDGRVESYADIADQLGISRGRLTQIRWFLRLSPEIQSKILLGNPPAIRAICERDFQVVTRTTDPKEQESRLKKLLARSTSHQD